MIKLLLRAGADVHGKGIDGLLPLSMAIRKFAVARDWSHRRRRLFLDVVITLLRAGASVAGVDFDITVTHGHSRFVHSDPYFRNALAHINGVRAAGSWRAFVMRPRLEILTLRGLANRGKIRSTDPALNNLVALPNELICQLLAFWFG